MAAVLPKRMQLLVRQCIKNVSETHDARTTIIQTSFPYSVATAQSTLQGDKLSQTWFRL